MTTSSLSDVMHYKKLFWTGHQIEIIENNSGKLVINIIPNNEGEFDTTSISHDRNDRVIRVSTIRKIEVC